MKEEFVPERYKLSVEQKLVYINEGKVIEFVKLKERYSRTVSKNDYIGEYPFFTGIFSTKLHIETAQFTVCQTIRYEDFKKKIKENAAEKNVNF